MIAREVFEQTLLEFFGPLRHLLCDPAVTEIMVNGPARVLVERDGKLESTQVQFANRDALLTPLRNAAQFIGCGLDREHPILQGRLPDGSRLQAVIEPAAPDGPYVCIRRGGAGQLTLTQLVEHEMLTSDAADFLQRCVAARFNLLISGGASSGKTTMLGALASQVLSEERLVTIEHCRELRLDASQVVALEAPQPDASGCGGVTVGALCRAALHLRPDRLVFGEIRGDEAIELIGAVTGGWSGCLATLQAATPRDALGRLELLCCLGDARPPLPLLQSLIASGIHLLVQLGKDRQGRRRVTHITEVVGVDLAGSDYQLRDLFVFQSDAGGAQRDTRPQLVATGAPLARQAQLGDSRARLPSAKYRAAGRAPRRSKG